MLSRGDFSHMRQGCNQSNRAVAAHAEISNVVKEDDTDAALWIMRFAQQRSYDDVRSSRLVYDCGAEQIMIPTKTGQARREWSSPEVRTTANHKPRRFSARVGIDYSNPMDVSSPRSLSPVFSVFARP